MSEVEFIFEGSSTKIQCNANEKMKEICQRFSSKNNIDIKDKFFLYSGNQIDIELKFSEIINDLDKQNNKIKLLVYESNKTKYNTSFIKSKAIICPKCGEETFLDINNYKIKLYDCKNNHNIDDISFDKFEDTQKIDISKIICNKCNEQNKAMTHYNNFYFCFTCNINLCPLCKSVHDQGHNIIDYDKKNYICNIHNESYIFILNSRF